jgi:hypothetical protein
MSATAKAHLGLALALLAAALLWLAVFALTPLRGAAAAVRYGSLLGLGLALLAVLAGYLSLLWAGRRLPASAGGPDGAAEVELRRSRRVVGAYAGGLLFRLALLVGGAPGLAWLLGWDLTAALLTAAAGYVPLSFVEVALLAGCWRRAAARPDATANGK